jgi:UTP--glucose-1-phosphate uridylyltransferase
MIRRAVIAAGGLGTRLLPATKEQPKEMLPVFANSGGPICLKPMIQLVFEQLHDFGVRQFLFVVGRDKRAIEDHFTPNYYFLERLRSKGKTFQARQLEEFHSKVTSSQIEWISQFEPLGFGHAVLLAREYARGEPFLLHAGDSCVISDGNNHLRRLAEMHQASNAEAVLTLEVVDDPRQYGVAEVAHDGLGTIVRSVVEKPERPKTKLAIVPIYIFDSLIFRALETVGPGKGDEIQLTDGIQKLIECGSKTRAVELGSGELKLDIGTPKSYWEALKLSYRYSSQVSTA